jgi:hypothetical protein
LAVGTGIGGFTVYRAAQHEPEFYYQALRAEPKMQAEAGDSLERSILDLHHDARTEGRWEAVFTEDQINGWLASDMPEKFPSLLPRGTQDPRVDLSPERIQVACRYDRGKFNSVISFVLEVALTEETNQLAIRINKVRAGVLPVPLKSFLDRIRRVADNADIVLDWAQTKGDPVALVTVPIKHEDYAHREVYLETIELRDGQLLLAGHTEQSHDKLIASVDQSLVPLAHRIVHR